MVTKNIEEVVAGKLTPAAKNIETAVQEKLALAKSGSAAQTQPKSNWLRDTVIATVAAVIISIGAYVAFWKKDVSYTPTYSPAYTRPETSSNTTPVYSPGNAPTQHNSRLSNYNSRYREVISDINAGRLDEADRKASRLQSDLKGN